MRRRHALRLAGIAALLASLAACHTVPITGRMALNPYKVILGVEQENSIGRSAFQDVKTTAAVAQSGPDAEMVERVMRRLVEVADDDGYEWEVVLLEDDSVVNALALPGGKMAVYTGILPVCQNEAGLAVVMGHEIGHVVGSHGTERMAQEMGVELLLQLVNTGKYEELARYAINVGQLKYSRDHESEADHIGLVYMARAGYDPRSAPAFWRRMDAGAQQAPPEFLSTHPSAETRIADLEKLMPGALAEYSGGRSASEAIPASAP